VTKRVQHKKTNQGLKTQWICRRMAGNRQRVSWRW